MEIKNIFEKDVERIINPVVVVGDQNESTLKEELEEYIITKELKPHFNNFFEAFSSSFYGPTKQMGVWISGFYGSGKSHFLKMLSYMLENREVCGKPTLDYFKEKYDDDLGFDDGIAQWCNKGKNKTILFNVDGLSGSHDDEAIRRVFAQAFYSSLGYYGNNLSTAFFEEYLDNEGYFENFKGAYKNIVGKTWEEDRRWFKKSKIVDALTSIGADQDAISKVHEKDTNIFNVNMLVGDIEKYVNKQGKDFRLIFMVDEIGQFIGENMSLMLNLQTIVEDLGHVCGGKVWVVVTSQEAIDKVIKVKGDIFTKILDRFGTRLSLTASSVEEVVRERLLKKNKFGTSVLNVIYDKKAASLKNTFTFENATSDLKGYTSDEQFANLYPVVPYQFRLLQDLLKELRVHGQIGYTKAGNARGLLVIMQTAINEQYEGKSLKNKDVGEGDNGALIPFYYYFDTISNSLTTETRENFDKAISAAHNNDGITDYDVSVLKLLYMVRYIDRDLKATISNLAILMNDKIDVDMIVLRKKVGESLERLKTEGYISKNGEVYYYLTNEESDVNNDIKKIFIDDAQIAKEIGQIIFSDLYQNKKVRYGSYNFDFDKYVDDYIFGSQVGGLRIDIVTPNNEAGQDNESRLILESIQNGGKVIVVLAREYSFYEKFREVLRVEKYNVTAGGSTTSQEKKNAISQRVAQAKADRKEVAIEVEKSIKEATFFVGGNKIEVKGPTAKEKIANALNELVEVIYTELGDIDHNFSDFNEVKSILTMEDSALTGHIAYNPKAVNKLSSFLSIKEGSHSQVTVADVYKKYHAIPYGFIEYDIAGMIAELIAQGIIVISYAGTDYKKADPIIMDLISKKSYIDTAIIKPKQVIDPKLVKQGINFMKEFTGAMDVPTKDDSLVTYIINTFTDKKNECEKFLNDYYSHGNYPQKVSVEKAKGLYIEVLFAKSDSVKLLTKLVEKSNDILDAKEELEEIVTFFNGPQKKLYDDAVRMYNFFKDDTSYLEEDADTKEALKNLKDVLSKDKPFRFISNLASYTQKIDATHEQMLENRKNNALSKIQDAITELGDYKKEHSVDIYTKHCSILSNEKTYVDGAGKITVIIAEEIKIDKLKSDAITELLNAKAPTTEDNPVVEPIKEPVQVSKTSLLEDAVLTSQKEVDDYIDKLKKKLYKMISEGGAKIN